MKKRRILLAFLALALALTTTLPSALAYFTANTQAAGGRRLRLGGNTQIEEVLAGWTKQVTITCTPVTQPVYLRARAYSVYPVEYKGDGWQAGEDGWYYYSTPLANLGEGSVQPQGTVTQASVLNASIRNIPTPGMGKLPEDFDVVLVYETTPVQYDENGNPYADWSLALKEKEGSL